MPLTLPEFVARRQAAATLSERSAAQSHFIDLCDVLGEPHPAAADPHGASYTFEKHGSKARGGKGLADVWTLGCFAWEYKGKHKNLDAAYHQLLDYAPDLENPPLLVVCDLDRFEMHTNLTNTRNKVYSFDLADLAGPSATQGSAGSWVASHCVYAERRRISAWWTTPLAIPTIPMHCGKSGRARQVSAHVPSCGN